MKLPSSQWRMAVVLMAMVGLTAGGCATAKKGHNLPPAQRLLEPGPGVGGPGPGVLPPPIPPDFGIVFPEAAQVLFAKPEGMQVRWDVGGIGAFDSEPMFVPGRQNFYQGGIYRLKLTNVPGKEGVELYPTLEIGPPTPRTEAYLSHNAIPMQFTPEDFDQVLSGNFVTKVIYLPDPEFQEEAVAGIEILISTRLKPGEDPIVEADRRGTILAVLRLGNKDLQTGQEEFFGGGVMPISYGAEAAAAEAGGPGAMMYHGGGAPGYPMMAGPTPMGMTGFGQAGLMPNYVSGLSSPAWGMPMTGTPIGLPGPPHVPLGVPAGLQKHVIANHTRMHIPDPTERVRIDVKQKPGMSYPAPATNAVIIEKANHGAPWFHPEKGDRKQQVYDGSQNGYCP